MSEWPEEIDRVYVLCHPVQEKARLERLIPHLQQHGVPSSKIQLCAPTWGSSLTPETIAEAYRPQALRGEPYLSFKAFHLTPGEVSLALNFQAAITDAVRCGHPKILVLESDVWIRLDFVPRLNNLLTDLSGRPWDVVSLGQGVGVPGCRPSDAPPSMFAPTRAQSPKKQGVFRCTDSMLFSRPFLEKLAKTFLPFHDIIDWELNFQAAQHRATVLWADPPLAEQGTCYGRLGTTLPA